MKASNRSSTRSATMRRLASRHLDLLALVPGFGELECTHQGARTRHRAMLRLSRYRKPAVGLRSRHAPERHQRADAHDREAIDTGGDACSRGLLRRWPLAFLEARMECMRRHALRERAIPSMWLQNERLPGLQWAIPPRHHVDRNRGLRDLDAQLEQFAMDLGWSFRKGQLAARQLASLFCMGQAWKIASGKYNTSTKNCILRAKYRSRLPC